MPNKLFKEALNGKYDGVTSPLMLPRGSLSDGSSIRKASQFGGWKARKGCALHNTTALESGAAAKSLHYYKNPIGGDSHFITQVNSKLVIESASNKLPPTQDTSYGTDLGVTVGTTPGFSTQVGEYFFYADGTSRPIFYNGTQARVRGFFSYDISNTAYVDYTRLVTDGRTDTEAICVGAATDEIIILTEQQADGFVFNLGGTVNSNSVTMVIKAWRSGTWTTVSSLSDGTASGGATLAVDGTVTWTVSALDELRVFGNIMGYAYQITWSGALSNSVDVISCDATQDPGTITNKWNGQVNWVTGCFFFDVSIGSGEYQEGVGKVTNESVSSYVDISSAATGDFLYFKTSEKATLFGFGIAIGFGNSANAEIDQMEYWDGDSWAVVTTNLIDGTLDETGDSSYSQTGTFSFDGSALSPQKRTFQGDEIAGYWYRFSWDAALSTDVRLYTAVYGTYPEVMPSYDGCVEFKGRLMLWGDPEFPNRLRFSAFQEPFGFCGSDSGYTEAFGDSDPILSVEQFYNELIVIKERGVWLLEGDNPTNFGVLKVATGVGIASPKSLAISEVGFPSAHKDEVLKIALWQDIDGVYTFDGRKTIKVSAPVDHYFNPEFAAAIATGSLRDRQAAVDPINNEYHLFLPSVELVYNYRTDEWYPPWTRAIVVDTALSFRATANSENRYFFYGASASGFVMKLESDTTDKNSSNADVAISHSIKSRAISYEQEFTVIRFTLRKLYAELKARSAGSITTKTFGDMATSGTTQATPSAMTMVSSGKSMVVPQLEMSIDNIRSFQVEFSLNTVDQEIELTSFYYEISGKGTSEQ